MNRKNFAKIISVMLVSMFCFACIVLSASAAGVSVNSVTAYRGDTVTFYATLTEEVEVGSGGMELIYAADVLELVSGSCDVAGASLATFDTATGKGAFAFAGTSKVSGNLFTVTFKVKDDAGFATTAVALNVTLRDGESKDIAVANNSGSVTVKCNHSFTNEEAADKYLKSAASCTSPAVYYKSCEICGEKGTATFNYGDKLPHDFIEKVDARYLKAKETCTSKAVYYESCSVCFTRGNETFEAGEEPSHNYNTAWSADAVSHWHECSKCGDKIDVTEHTAGAPATEDTAQTCTVCGYVITPALGHKHNFGSSWKSDPDKHWYECSGCGEMTSVSEHIYDNACDPECNFCWAIRDVSHSYGTEYSKNAEKHWLECSGCGAKKSSAYHTPGAPATETEDQVCTVCGYIIVPSLGHTHDYNTGKNDENNHWNECACGDKADVAAHTWDDGVVTREATYDEEGEKTYTCSVCSYTKTESIEKLVREEEPTTAPTVAEPTEDPGVTEEPEDGCGSAIGVGAASVIAIVACGAAIILKKKEDN